MLAYTRSSVPIGMAALAGLLLTAETAGAVDSVQNETLSVEVLVGDACTVTSASLTFPAYDGAAQGVTGTGNIDIDCVAETEVSVKLNGGSNTSNGEGQRTLMNGSSPLTYVLYTNSSRTDPWLTNGIVTTTITDTGSVPVYGSIPGSQAVGDAGLYSDEVTITLSF